MFSPSLSHFADAELTFITVQRTEDRLEETMSRDVCLVETDIKLLFGKAKSPLNTV